MSEEKQIKVGEYVRTKDGKIIKFNKFGTLRVGCINPKYYKTIISNRRHYKYDDIVKHSSNLKDIIQKDDFVNKCRVFEVEEKGITVYQTVENSATDYNWISFDEIEEIVTKEMMESISYKVERKD